MRTTKTGENRLLKSPAVRKGSMTQSEIEAVAKELQPDIIQVVEAPKIESERKPVKEEGKKAGKRYYEATLSSKGDYGVYASLIRAHCEVHETYEATVNELRNVFPQTKKTANIARNLKRSHGISYRRVENGDNDTYVFFIEPTREELILEIAALKTSNELMDSCYKDNNILYLKNEELIVQLTSAESKALELEKRTNNYNASYVKRGSEIKDLKEENTKIKSELYQEKSMTIVSFVFAIICLIITISSGTISNLLTQIFGSLTQLQ